MDRDVITQDEQSISIKSCVHILFAILKYKNNTFLCIILNVTDGRVSPISWQLWHQPATVLSVFSPWCFKTVSLPLQNKLTAQCLSDFNCQSKAVSAKIINLNDMSQSYILIKHMSAVDTVLEKVQRLTVKEITSTVNR